IPARIAGAYRWLTGQDTSTSGQAADAEYYELPPRDHDQSYPYEHDQQPAVTPPRPAFFARLFGRTQSTKAAAHHHPAAGAAVTPPRPGFFARLFGRKKSSKDAEHHQPLAGDEAYASALIDDEQPAVEILPDEPQEPAAVPRPANNKQTRVMDFGSLFDEASNEAADPESATEAFDDLDDVAPSDDPAGPIIPPGVRRPTADEIALQEARESAGLDDATSKVPAAEVAKPILDLPP